MLQPACHGKLRLFSSGKGVALTSPTPPNFFDRATIRRVMERVPKGDAARGPEVLEACSQLTALIHAYHGAEGVNRFLQIAREVAAEMQRENQARAVAELQRQIQRQVRRNNAPYVVMTVIALFMLGWSLAAMVGG